MEDTKLSHFPAAVHTSLLLGNGLGLGISWVVVYKNDCVTRDTFILTSDISGFPSFDQESILNPQVEVHHHHHRVTLSGKYGGWREITCRSAFTSSYICGTYAPTEPLLIV